MKRTLCILLLLQATTTHAQKQQSGIQFQELVSSKILFEKARAEGKYVFVDCFTTWCIPCKKMDKEIYTNDSVAAFFNNQFINIKVQMDSVGEKPSTANDQFAADLNEAYKILSYPTYLFFSPQGKIVKKESGYQNVSAFLSLGREAVTPGTTYNDPYKEYNALARAYRGGVKDYAKMFYMIQCTKSTREQSLMDSLEKDYKQYLANLPRQYLFDSSHLQYIGSIISSSNDPYFSLFYPNTRKADKIVGRKNFSRSIIDRVIRKEFTQPVLKSVDTAKGGKPNWDSIQAAILKSYPRNYASRAILAAKTRWYEYINDTAAYLQSFIRLQSKHGNVSLLIYRLGYILPDEPAGTAIDLILNGAAWMMFNYTSDKKQIKAALGWMKGVIERSKNVNPFWHHLTIDTYACLLYKSGQKKEAITWQIKALELAQQNGDKDSAKDYQKKINSIQNGQPTW
ncbi:MAG: DUF255 domain-containing protein [Sphingobacteriales bacterium]|nr:DUF255 domain-containing protein [Sphingobacteriales bacterium]